MQLETNVCCWHFSEVPPAAVNFRFRAKSGRRRFHVSEQCALLAFSRNDRLWNVRSKQTDKIAQTMKDAATGRSRSDTAYLTAE